eukprot:Gb_28806 [translate_table: standard]
MDGKDALRPFISDGNYKIHDLISFTAEGTCPEKCKKCQITISNPEDLTVIGTNERLEACVHPFFDELRDPNTRLPNGRPLPPLFNFKPQELKGASPELIQRLIPEHARKQNPLISA